MDVEYLVEEYKNAMFVEDEEATRVDSLAIADLTFDIHEETGHSFEELIEFGNTNQHVFVDIKSFKQYLQDIVGGNLFKSEVPTTIKLVVWDLDDTLWKGTLSEDSEVVLEGFGDKVKELVSAGVMNSICSKNNFDDAKAKLEELGLWDYFVFPSIDWTPKGERVKSIIEDMQLRPANVLFIDDNVGNLNEVSFVLPEVTVTHPLDVGPWLSMAISNGKDDSSHSRLKQYKVLERKHVAKTNFKSNIDFLKASEIKATILSNPEEHFDRILEMITRTNQLNFTKLRSTEEELREQLKQNENAVIKVSDKFGDYGIVGFVSITGEAIAEHFLFSCRVLGMGVESQIFKWLYKPDIEFAEPLAYELEMTGDNGSWVEVEDLR